MEEAAQAPGPDVVLEVGGELFPANRRRLSRHSRYFEALFFGGDFRERSQPRVCIQGVGAEAFGALLSFTQTGALPVSRDNAAALLEAADFLGLEGPKRRCEAFLERELRAGNCLGLMAFAQRFACPRLLAAARGVALSHWAEVAALDEMPELSPEALAALLRSDRLFVAREDQALEALLRWVAAEPAGRRGAFLELAALVRGPCLSLPFLDWLVKRGRQPGEEDLTARLLQELDAHPPRSWTPSGRDPCAGRGHEDILVLAGRHDREQQDLLCFQPKTGAWQPCAPLQRRNLTQYAVATVGDLLFVTGGSFREAFSWEAADGVLVYSSWEDRWQEGPPLGTARHSHCAARVGPRLFVAGGAGTEGGLTPDVESLAPGEAAWRSASPMARPVERAAAAGLGPRLYVLGGLEASGDVCPAVQRLDADADVWDQLALSPLPRYDLCAAALNGAIFTVGGGALRLEVDTGEWTPLEEEEEGEGEGEGGQGRGVRLGRRFFKACAAANGRLFLLAQRQGNGLLPNLLLVDPYLEPRCRELDPQVPCPLPIQAAAPVRCFGPWR